MGNILKKNKKKLHLNNLKVVSNSSDSSNSSDIPSPLSEIDKIIITKTKLEIESQIISNKNKYLYTNDEIKIIFYNEYNK
jgi:precorrin-6B methylase 2